MFETARDPYAGEAQGPDQTARNSNRSQYTTKQAAGASRMLDCALAYAASGIPVFPLRWVKPDGECSCGKPRCPHTGKHPQLSGSFYDATTDAKQIRAWWGSWPNANIGMPTGVASGRDVIDEDVDDGGDVAPLRLPPTRTAVTPNGGHHYHFAHVEGTSVPKDNTGKLGDHVDMQGEKAYVVLPPSRTDKGAYAWVDEARPVAPFPVRLLEMLQPKAKPDPQPRPRAEHNGHKPEGDTGAHWLEWARARTRAGDGDNTGFLLAQQLLVEEANGKRVNVRDVLLTYADEATQDPMHPFTAHDVDRWIASARKNGKLVAGGETAKARGTGGNAANGRQRQDAGGSENAPAPKASPQIAAFSLDDTGNAERLVARHGADIRYCASWAKWLMWDGTRWAVDDQLAIMLRVKATVRSIYGEAEHEQDDSRAKEIAKHAARSQSAKARAAMELLARPELPIAPDAFDTNPWLLNVANGTLDLRTGQLREHRREDYITKLAPIVYDDQAQCPTILAWLNDIFEGKQAIITFLQRYIGYTLTGSTREHKMPILHGTGRNGKSTLLELLRDMLGDYGMQTPASTLMAKEKEGVPNDVARLKGARFVSAVETEEGRRLAEALVKQLTGGDTVSARFMRAEWFDFKPVFKVWLATNHKPNIRGTDNAIWARIQLIPFNVSYLGREDTTLPDRLHAELPGFLAWAVRGCLDWQREGLTNPPEVASATEEYRAEMDSLGDFLADCCELLPTATITNKPLRAAYEQWCEDNGETKLGTKTFSQKLAERPGIKKTDHLGEKKERGWAGLRLKSPDRDTSGTYGTLGDTKIRISGPEISHEGVTRKQVSPSVPSVPDTLERPSGDVRGSSGIERVRAMIAAGWGEEEAAEHVLAELQAKRNGKGAR